MNEKKKIIMWYSWGSFVLSFVWLHYSYSDFSFSRMRGRLIGYWLMIALWAVIHCDKNTTLQTNCWGAPWALIIEISLANSLSSGWSSVFAVLCLLLPTSKSQPVVHFQKNSLGTQLSNTSNSERNCVVAFRVVCCMWNHVRRTALDANIAHSLVNILLPIWLINSCGD